VSALHVSVAARESGPVVILAGEADLTAVTQLNEALATQLSGRTSHLTIDASNLFFADSVSIRALMTAAVILRDRGGSLVLWHPQPPVARTLGLLGIDRMFTIRARPQDGTGPDGGPDRQRLGSRAVSMLQASVTAGEYGPLIMLSGIADVTTGAALTGVISGQVSAGAQHLRIDVSGLRFADSSAIWLLIVVARTLIRGGGRMTLIRPQPAVAKMLALVDADQVITIWGGDPLGPARVEGDSTAENMPDLNPGRFGPAGTRQPQTSTPGRGEAGLRSARPPGHWPAINPGYDGLLTVTYGQLAVQVRP
jgi:anti-anti-sigma factor